MSKRNEHTFEFPAQRVAEAAKDEADYHQARIDYWQQEWDEAIVRVEATIGAKITRRPVTGGEEVDVVVDYGDYESWQQAQRAFHKIRRHREAAEGFRSDQRVYETQNGRVYELDLADVQHFRLGGEPRED